MSTSSVDSSRLMSAIGQVSHIAKNLHGDLMATASSDQTSKNFIQIWSRQASSDGWTLLITLHAGNHPTTSLAFCQPENGLVLACGTCGGHLLIYEARRPRSSLLPPPQTGDVAMATDQGAPDDTNTGSWSLAADLSCGKHPISSLAFAPRQLGLAIALASADGSCLVVEGDRPLGPETWTLQSSFKASAHSSRSQSLEGSHYSLCWRPSFDPHVAPLMAVAGPGGGVVSIWQYLQSTMGWKEVKSLKMGQAPEEEEERRTLVHWAPTLGRPSDLIAAAQGSTVEVFSLTGDTSDLR